VKQQLLSSEQDKLYVGDFGAQKKISRWYDGNYLSHALEADQADIVLKKETVYHVNVEALQQLLRQGEIPPEVMRLAYHEEPPTAAMIPGGFRTYSLPPLPVEEENECQQPPEPEVKQKPPGEKKPSPKRSSNKIGK
jgi:hypothetical protein